jgi:signal peptidase II
MATEVTVSPQPRAAGWRRAGILTVAVLILDQLTKHTLATSVAGGETKKFLPGVELVHVRNTGVAFGVFSGGGALVLIFTLAALSLLLVYFARRPDRAGLWIPTGLLVGGALGNLVDRIRSGAVTDFIKLPLWPAFNVADMAITFGILALIYVLDSSGAGRDRD